MRRYRTLVAAAWVGVVATVAIGSTVVAAPAEAQSTLCSPPAQLPPEPTAPHDAPFITVPEGKKIVLPFGDSREPDSRARVLSVTGRSLVRSDFARIGVFGRPRLDAGFGDAGISNGAGHEIRRNGGVELKLIPLDDRRIELCVVVKPTEIANLAADRYSGMISVTYGTRKMQLASVPVELTFRDSRRLAVAAAFLAVLLGVAVKLLSDAAAKQRSLEISARRALSACMSDLSFPVTVILAGLAGVLVFVEMYANNPAWGGIEDVTKLFAVSFIAQMSGNEGIDMVARVAGGGPAVQQAARSV